MEERKKEHNESAKLENPKKKQIVHRALKKFNMIDTFQLIEIDNTATSIEELYEKEKVYIEQYNSYYKNKKGYNMTLGGDGNHGYVHTKADRKKISQKMSQIQKKRYSDPAQREKTRKAQLQRYSDPAQREKASQIQKKRFSDPAQREKASQIQKKRYSDPAQREKTSKAQSQRYSDPAQREKASQIQKKRFSDPEARKKEKNRKLFKVFRKKNMEFIKQFEYQFEAIEYIQKAFDLNVSRRKISDVLKKNIKSTQGFLFEYI